MGENREGRGKDATLWIRADNDLRELLFKEQLHAAKGRVLDCPPEGVSTEDLTSEIERLIADYSYADYRAEVHAKWMEEQESAGPPVRGGKTAWTCGTHTKNKVPLWQYHKVWISSDILAKSKDLAGLAAAVASATGNPEAALVLLAAVVTLWALQEKDKSCGHTGVLLRINGGPVCPKHPIPTEPGPWLDYLHCQ